MLDHPPLGTFSLARYPLEQLRTQSGQWKHSFSHTHHKCRNSSEEFWDESLSRSTLILIQFLKAKWDASQQTEQIERRATSCAVCGVKWSHRAAFLINALTECSLFGADCRAVPFGPLHQSCFFCLEWVGGKGSGLDHSRNWNQIKPLFIKNFWISWKNIFDAEWSVWKPSEWVQRGFSEF